MTSKDTMPTNQQLAAGDSLPPVICVGFPRWEGGDYLTSTVQLMSELARHERVLYIDYPFTYKDLWSARNKPESGIPVKALRGEESSLQTRELRPNGQVHLLRLPPFLPANFIASEWLYDLVLRLNASRALRAIRRAIAELGWEDERPIVINAFNPALGNALAGKLNESFLAYYCYDEISAAPWIARHGARHEQYFLRTADCTVVSSRGLWRNKAPFAKDVALVQNGVDLSIFQSSGHRPTDLPEGPIIGYIGSVDERLDLELLQAVAAAFPNTPLVLLGRVVAEEYAAALRKFSNVHVLGTRPRHQLGDYVAAFSVGLIPFVKNELTAGIYPLKINEYFALQVPVVSTHFADLSDFDAYIRIGENTADFVRALKRTLAGDLAAEPAACQAFAQQNTWEGRAAKLRQLFMTSLQQKQPV